MRGKGGMGVVVVKRCVSGRHKHCTGMLLPDILHDWYGALTCLVCCMCCGQAVAQYALAYPDVLLLFPGQ